MATNKINSLFIFITLISMAPHLHRAVANLARDWCTRTTHSATCLSIVNADRRANLKTSPNGLATILRDKALTTAQATLIKITSLSRRARNPHEIAALKSCSAGYLRAISSLKTAKFAVINRDVYGIVLGAISDANDEPRDCELAFQEPPAIPSPISANNNRLRDILATNLEIINLIVCNSPSFC
ncbi:hypothetical protein CDL12_18019 [Handroanthus impetiginosus]|uniref:Pectinesterase inhibitor domain-containing protein n=1 Tax=Handroanthus impetiginosus TaxID=429701 RepID=A0A2G9GCG2_9LAMI|nr:hypothetical protein CDL12_24487 [Handroanthus impetiginosus]PIN09405.1 hypothetical protein CDL12_18019 [Handroanthus impetiginosus]